MPWKLANPLIHVLQKEQYVRFDVEVVFQTEARKHRLYLVLAQTEKQIDQ